MKHRQITVALGVLFSIHSFAQVSDTDRILELSNFYGKNVMSFGPDKKELKKIGIGYPPKFNYVTDFIKETTKANNVLLTDKYLTLPDTFSMRVVYIIDALYQNPNKKVKYPPEQLVDSLLSANIDRNDLIDEYYSTIFTSIENKLKPFDLTGVNIQLDRLIPNDSTGQAILFLRCLETCGKFIRGYMGMSEVPKLKEAFEEIKKYPTFNGKPYYHFKGFPKTDFYMEIYNDRGKESYYENLIGSFYSTLYNHLVCISNLTEDSETFYDLWYKSILSDPAYYQYAYEALSIEFIKLQEEINNLNDN